MSLSWRERIGAALVVFGAWNVASGLGHVIDGLVAHQGGAPAFVDADRLVADGRGDLELGLLLLALPALATLQSRKRRAGRTHADLRVPLPEGSVWTVEAAKGRSVVTALTPASLLTATVPTKQADGVVTRLAAGEDPAAVLGASAVVVDLATIRSARVASNIDELVVERTAPNAEATVRFVFPNRGSALAALDELAASIPSDTRKEQEGNGTPLALAGLALGLVAVLGHLLLDAAAHGVTAHGASRAARRARALEGLAVDLGTNGVRVLLALAVIAIVVKTLQVVRAPRQTRVLEARPAEAPAATYDAAS